MLNYRDHWQDDEIQALQTGLSEGLSDRELSSRIGRTLRGVSRKRRQLGIAPIYRQERHRWCDWTKEREAKLIELVAAGLSNGKIAEEMGITRNAVIGKSHRLRLPRRGRPQYVLSPKPPRLRRSLAKRAARIPFPKIEIVVPLRIQLVALESHHCRYPLDDKDDNGLILYCGNPKHGDQSWCIGHCGIVFDQRPRGQAHGHFGIFK